MGVRIKKLFGALVVAVAMMVVPRPAQAVII